MREQSAKRVLVVAYDFPPHGAIGTMRTLRVVRELARRGWVVTVLTGDPASYLSNTPVDMALLERVPADVQVIRAGALRGVTKLEQLVRPQRAAGTGKGSAARPEQTARRGHQVGVIGHLARVKDVVDTALSIPDRESGWFLPALARGLVTQMRRDRPDVIYSSAPPWTGQIVAAGLKTALRCPWVADFRDPWARAPWRGERMRFAVRASAMLERAVIRRADHVLFVTHANRDEFAAHYGAAIAPKLHIVPNGCDPSEFDALERPDMPSNGRFVLLHAGSLYGGRSPVSLFNAVAAAIEQGTIDPRAFRIRFMGPLGLGIDLPHLLQRLGLEQVVEFMPRVPRDQSLRAMMSASALLLLQPGHAVSVPGKFYEYLAAGRPILSIAEEGETAQLVRASGIGISVAPGDEAGMVAALPALLRMAESPIAPPRRELYDGNARAAETAEILEAVVNGDHVPHLAADVAALPVSLPAGDTSRMHS